MPFKAPLPVWFAAAAVAYGLLSIPIEEAQSAPSLTGVVSVIDGDTLDLHGQRIRLHALDAPEKGQTCRRDGKDWRCGQAAALALADKIGRRTVHCEPRDTDRYQRVVAVCFLGDEDLGAWLVGQGLAVAYPQYGKAYVPVEAEARQARRGIWAGTFVLPKDWRKGQRN